MNERPITTPATVMLQRPLLWAGLCSIFLHLPVLLILSTQWPQTTQSRDKSQEQLLVTLLADLDIQQGQDLDTEPVPESAVVQSSLIQSYDVQSYKVQSFDVPNPAPQTSAAQNLIAGITPASTLPAPSVPAPSAPVPASATLADTRVPVPVPVALPESVPVPLTMPASIPMAQQDINQMQVAIDQLVAQFNQAATQEGMQSQAEPPPESAGLPASDRIVVTTAAAENLNALQQVDITLTRQIDGQSYQMRARLQERALSHYAKFVNNWDDKVMLSNDRIDGRFHANSAVNFETSLGSRPQFNGVVTIANRQRVGARMHQSAMFTTGLRTNIGRIALPRQALAAHWLDTGATVITMESDSRLDFQGHDGLLWTDLNNNVQTYVSVPAEGLIIMGGQRARLELSGIVAGRVLVHSPRQLMIIGNLVYADNTAASDDTLALISEGSIEIAPASVTGAGDLAIHGALYARERFSVRRFRDRHQGTLSIYGALVTGSVSATEPRFDTHIKFDRRFDSIRPPAFPSTGLFDLVAWDQHWTAVNDYDELLADVADNVPIAAP